MSARHHPPGSPVLTAFPPLAGDAPHLLILGTMPGARSLAAGEYYAHPQNQFWRLMCELFGADPTLPYEARTAVLTGRGIAVWDVLQSCVRPGSLDTSIRDAQLNDFPAFFARYPGICRVVFNSAKAEELYKRKALPRVRHLGLSYARVPSPSPAHASLGYAAKLELWRDALTGAPS